MKKEGKKYKVKSKVVLWSGEQGSWHFAGVGGKVAKELRETFGKSSRGFGSLPVEVTIGKTTWKTSVFWDSRSKGYLLPIKASVRKTEGIFADDIVEMVLEVAI